MQGHEGENGTRPEVTLILATYLGHDTIRETLDSIAAQTLSPERFELLIIENGPPGPTSAIVREWRVRHPDVQVREAPVHLPGLSHARNLALALARGAHVTYVDDDDALSPRYLEVLLDLASPGVVPTAFLVDVPEGVTFESVNVDSPDLDNYYSGALARFAGRTIPAELASEALSVNAGKLLPTELARAMRYHEHLRSGEDFVYWTALFAHTELCLTVAPVHAGACYLRRVRAGSMSRKDLSYEFSVTQRLDCIEALDDLPLSSPVVERVVRGKGAAQTRHLRDYLVAHPEDRQRVLKDIASRSVRHLDQSALTRNLAHDVCILYCFAPSQDTSAVVASRRIRARGAVVDVISNSLDSVRARDDWSLRVASGYVDESIVLDVPQAFSSWMPIRRFMEDVQPELERRQRRKGRYQSVYSRSMWPASHFAAALFKVRNPQVTWIAEFSDPQLITVTGEERPERMVRCELVDELEAELVSRGFSPPEGLQTFAWAEWLPYVLADEIMFTNENQREYMLGYCSAPALAALVRDKSRVEHHPTLPSEFYSEIESDYALDPDVCNIGYFGVFYSTRGLDEVTGALAGLPEHLRERLRLHIFTDKPAESRSAIETLGLGDMVVVSGYRPFLEFLNLTTRFDVLLVNDARTLDHHPMNPYLPSKLSDYLGGGRAIWSVVEPGSVLDSTPTTYSSRLGDIDGARAILTEIANPRSAQTVLARQSG